MNGTNQNHINPNSKKAHISEAAVELLDESKKYAHELYEDGLDKVEKAKQEAHIYTEELLTKVRENPLKAILIAGGVGLILSTLLRK